MVVTWLIAVLVVLGVFALLAKDVREFGQMVAASALIFALFKIVDPLGR